MATPSAIDAGDSKEPKSLHDPIRDRHLRIVAAGALLVVLGVTILVSLVHIVDTDEGSDLLAGKMISQGSVLYFDFNFPYPPVPPYAYAAWFRLFGHSWVSGRVLSALLAAAVGWVLYVGVRRATGRRSVAIAALLMFGLAAQTLTAFTEIKPQAIATLLLLGSYVVIAYGRSAPILRFGSAGALFALAVSARSYFVVLAPLMFFEAYRASFRSGRFRAISWFLAGALVGGMVNLPFLIRGPSVFWHGVIGAQLSRGSGGAVGSLAPKISVLRELLGFRSDASLRWPAAVQFWALLTANVAYVILCVRRGYRVAGSVGIAAILILVSFLPDPPYSHYWSIAIPFLVFASALLLGHVLEMMPARWASTLLGAGIVVLVLGFVVVGQNDVRRFLDHDLGGDHAPSTELAMVRAVSKAIDANTRPGDQVLAFWPGYLVETHARPVPRIENQSAWAPLITRNTPSKDHERFRLAAPDYVAGVIRAHVPSLVVVQHDFSWLYDPLPATFFDAILVDAGYESLVHVGTATIYRCCRGSSP